MPVGVSEDVEGRMEEVSVAVYLGCWVCTTVRVLWVFERGRGGRKRKREGGGGGIQTYKTITNGQTTHTQKKSRQMTNAKKQRDY